MNNGRLDRWRNRWMGIYPVLGLILVFLGPYFFFQCLRFLRTTDYAAGLLAFLAGWALLRSGIDLTRAYLATTIPEQDTHEQETSLRK